MIQKIRTGLGMVARFGSGTVRIHCYTLKTRFGAQVELVTCDKQEVGSGIDHDLPLPKGNKIVLDFSNIESLDVLIGQLQGLKEDFETLQREV